MLRTERCSEGKIGEGGERQREGEKEMKTKKESQPGGEKRTEIGLEGKKEKNRCNLEGKRGTKSW